MDNFRFSMTAEGDNTLKAAMNLAFSKHGAATHYVIRDPEPAIKDPEKSYLDRPARPRRMIFLWSGKETDKAVAFPFKMDSDGAADFAIRWLKDADYGREPDHDGDNGRGWQVYNEAWGHIDELRYTIVAVAPAWAMYGK